MIQPSILFNGYATIYSEIPVPIQASQQGIIWPCVLFDGRSRHYWELPTYQLPFLQSPALKIGRLRKREVGKKICHDPLGAKIKRNCFASRFRLPNCGKFPRLNIAVSCKEPICCWESPTKLLLTQIHVNWSPWLFSPWWRQTLIEWIDLIRPQAFWVTSQCALCTDLTSKHGEFFRNHREEPIECDNMLVSVV